MFKKTCKTLGYMKIIVCKIPPEGGGAKNHIYEGLDAGGLIFTIH